MRRLIRDRGHKDSRLEWRPGPHEHGPMIDCSHLNARWQSPSVSQLTHRPQSTVDWARHLRYSTSTSISISNGSNYKRRPPNYLTLFAAECWLIRSEWTGLDWIRLDSIGLAKMAGDSSPYEISASGEDGPPRYRYIYVCTCKHKYLASAQRIWSTMTRLYY